MCGNSSSTPPQPQELHADPFESDRTIPLSSIARGPYGPRAPNRRYSAFSL